MSLIVLYFLHSNSLLTFYKDEVLTLSFSTTWMVLRVNWHKLCCHRTPRSMPTYGVTKPQWLKRPRRHGWGWWLSTDNSLCPRWRRRHRRYILSLTVWTLYILSFMFWSFFVYLAACRRAWQLAVLSGAAAPLPLDPAMLRWLALGSGTRGWW